MQSVRIRPIQVYLIAPPMVCWGLERLIQTAHPQLELRGSSAALDEALGQVEKNALDVIVAHLDGAEQLELLEQLHSRTSARVLIVTASNDSELLDKAVLGGVRGVIKTNEPPSVLLKAIEKIYEGEMWIDRSATSRIFMEMIRQKAAQANDPEKAKMSTLTSRERQTIVAVASDASAPGKVIAGRLCISEHTLRNHLTSIYSKLGLCSRLDLYAYATRHSLNKPF